MIELRLHKDVYVGAAVDAAMKQFARYARLTARDDASHWVVQIEAATPARARTVAGELGNAALGGSAKARPAVQP